MVREEREEADVCADVENTIAIPERDAVFEIDLFLEDVRIKESDFGAALVSNLHVVRQTAAFRDV